jgi:hypothetical protein
MCLSCQETLRWAVNSTTEKKDIAKPEKPKAPQDAMPSTHEVNYVSLLIHKLS